MVHAVVCYSTTALLFVQAVQKDAAAAELIQQLAQAKASDHAFA